MSNKVTIIGAGTVGSTIAYTMAVQEIASEIVLIDINEKKALGEAMDIRQGTPYCHPVNIYSGGYEDASGSDVVIITSGITRKPGQSRLDLTKTNVKITGSIMKKIVKAAPDAIYIIVGNPVDIITYQFCKYSGLPEHHIIGSGTALDTSRLRSYIAEYYNINEANVHAFIFGEHGDSSFVPWSVATISNVNIDQYPSCLKNSKPNKPVLDHAFVEDFVRKSGGEIIKRKGATFFAIAVSICHIVKCIFNGAETTMTISTMMHGEYGIDDVCLSILTVVGRDGICGKVVLPLTEEEATRLQYSSQCLKNVIDRIEF